MLGHESLETTMRYVNVTGKDTRKTMELLVPEASQIDKEQLPKAGSWEKHWGDLAEASSKLVSNLRLLQRYVFLEGEHIGEIVINREDEDQIRVIDKFMLKCLLQHMQTELPTLTCLDDWSLLKVGDIDDELLHSLSLRAAQRFFKGRCEAWQEWD